MGRKVLCRTAKFNPFPAKSKGSWAGGKPQMGKGNVNNTTSNDNILVDGDLIVRNCKIYEYIEQNRELRELCSSSSVEKNNSDIHNAAGIFNFSIARYDLKVKPSTGSNRKNKSENDSCQDSSSSEDINPKRRNNIKKEGKSSKCNEKRNKKSKKEESSESESEVDLSEMVSSRRRRKKN